MFTLSPAPAAVATAPAAAPIVVKPAVVTECDKLERKIKSAEMSKGLQSVKCQLVSHMDDSSLAKPTGCECRIQKFKKSAAGMDVTKVAEPISTSTIVAS